MFEDPLEVKLNVLVITLYTVDKGYSIKISVNKNESPAETFFKYEEDTILKYVQREQLPPHLLESFEKAELFYNGCVIAEIHDLQDGVPGELYRILLRPFDMVSSLFKLNFFVMWTFNS